MTLRPDRRDLGTVTYYLGKVAVGLSLVMAVPALLAVVLREWNSATALLAGAAVTMAVGQAAQWRAATSQQLTLAQGTVVVAVGWLVGPMLAGIPLLLSGHIATPLDAWFEAMSGLTTSGLSVIQDLDHVPYSMSVYRHMLHFVGGQGIVIVVLALVTAAGGRLGTLYVAEGRNERVVPSVVRTARFIFLVAGVYLAVGTTALTGAAAAAGITGWRALYHGAALFFAAFDTGGFAPTSQSIAYYHSVPLEAVTVVLMVAGTLSFALHYHLWHRRFGAVARDTELRTLAVSVVALVALALVGLAAAGSYLAPDALVRKGFFTVVSAHTGTGFAVTDGTRMLTDWGTLAPAAVVFAMALGGMAGSTAGGVKAIRVALTLRGVLEDVRRVLLPEAAYHVATYHSGRRRIMRAPLVRTATVIALLYGSTYLVGAIVGLLYERWDVRETMFESVSAAANVGLSVGIVGPGMPWGLELTYLLQMWVGRLEFMAAFALVGVVVAVAKVRPR